MSALLHEDQRLTLQALKVACETIDAGTFDDDDVYDLLAALGQCERMARVHPNPELHTLNGRAQRILAGLPITTAALDVVDERRLVESLRAQLSDEDPEMMSLFAQATELDAHACAAHVLNADDLVAPVLSEATTLFGVYVDGAAEISPLAEGYMAHQGIEAGAPGWEMWSMARSALAFIEAPVESMVLPAGLMAKIEQAAKPGVLERAWAALVIPAIQSLCDLVAPASAYAADEGQVLPLTLGGHSLREATDGRWRLVVERPTGVFEVALYTRPGDELRFEVEREGERVEILGAGARRAFRLTPGRYTIHIGDEVIEAEHER